MSCGPRGSTLSVLLGHYIKDIDRGSPAERAGLKEMDRLVAVAGEEVDQCTHDQVVDKIRQAGNKCWTPRWSKRVYLHEALQRPINGGGALTEKKILT